MPKADSIRVLAYYVNNDIEVHDTVTLYAANAPSAVYESEVETLSALLYPNPVSQSSTLRFVTSNAGMIKVVLRDMSGKTLKTYADEFMSDGQKEFHIESLSLSNGKYFIEIVTPSGSVTMPMIVNK